MGKSVLAVALLLALAGCGVSSAPQQESSAKAAPAAATHEATAAAAATPTRAPKPKVDRPKKWIRENYPGVYWVKFIQRTDTQFGAIWVYTSLPPDAKDVGADICRAVSAYELDGGGEFTGVTVRAGTGNRLSFRKHISDPC